MGRGEMEAQESLKQLEKKAESGDGSAARTLGDHYRTGDIVSQDLNLAFRWYSRGAELGDREAQNNLGTLFLDGLGCERDKVQAPVLAGSAELGGLWAFPAVRLGDADGGDERIDKREYHVAGRDFSHRFIKGVLGPVRVALRRPEVAAGLLLPVGLILVHPPIPHG